MRRTILCFLSLTVLAAAADVLRAQATKAAPAKPAGPPLISGVMFAKMAMGKHDPAAIILRPAGVDGGKFVDKWRADLNDAGFAVFLTRTPKGGWIGKSGEKLLADFGKYVAKGNSGGAWAIVRKVNANRILIMSERSGGAAAMAMIEKAPQKISGAVMISVAPWIQKSESIKLWRPSREAWSVPMWATVPVNVKAGSPLLLLWRRIAAAKPQAAPFTIDPRIQIGDKEPDAEIAKWISSIASGKEPKPGPDRQAQQEAKRYKASAKQLLTAMQVVKPADSGARVAKTEGPLALSATGPNEWRRVERGERKYDPIERPFVQLYFSPKPGSMLFARANGAKWGGDANGLLDMYEKRLAEGGFLAVRHARWAAKGYSLQISSVLWPSRGKLHRWLILIGAGPGNKKSPAAPLVVVMDATNNPNVNAMAAAMKRILPSVSVTWKGL